MKFTNGYWLMRPDCTPHYALQVQDIETRPDALTVYAATRPVRHRGDTLSNPLLTIKYSSPLESVIKVEVWHHQGGGFPKPEFDLQEHDGELVR